MPKSFIIQGKMPLSGTIDVRGSKNAALPILAATLLTAEKCRIRNLPLVLDVFLMVKMLEQMGGYVKWVGKRSVEIENRNVFPERLQENTVSAMRASILFLGPLLARFGKLDRMKYPGGCSIGARPIDIHLTAFKDLGARVTLGRKYFSAEIPRNFSVSTDVILGEFSVTATENVMMFLAASSGKNQIRLAASEPHIQDLARFLSNMGAQIRGAGTTTVTVRGSQKLRGASHSVISDYIEAGTFIFAALISGDRVVINNFSVPDLDAVLKKLTMCGARIHIAPNKKSVEVCGMLSSPKTAKMTMDKIQVLPHPGLPTDLQSLFGVLATQTHGPTLIHEPLYEKRLAYLRELKKMGALIKIQDSHRAIVQGPTALIAKTVTARDLRGGAALVVAGLGARGRTKVVGAEHVDRGYEDLEGRLCALGADIERV